MRLRKRQPLFNLLLDTGLNLIDSLRDRLPDNVDDIRDRARDTYNTASDRVSRATDVLRGAEESHLFGKAVAMVIGVGVGVGIGLLIAPASGDETLEEISDKVSEFKENVRQRKNPQGATGTEGD
jgi:YtxH-like protein